MEHRLSEEEIDEIVEKVCDKLTDKIYKNVGAGLIALMWKGLILIILGIAAYGAGVHWFK